MKREGKGTEGKGRGREGEKRGGRGPTQMLEPGPPVALLRYWPAHKQTNATEKKLPYTSNATSNHCNRLIDSIHKHKFTPNTFVQVWRH